MKTIEDKRIKEKQTVGLMIDLYCKNNHPSKKTCNECNSLKQYAYQKIDKCPFMETKTFCSKCKIHCYEKQMREQIKTVMRYSGPRMIFYHPVLAIKHLIESKKED